MTQSNNCNVIHALVPSALRVWLRQISPHLYLSLSPLSISQTQNQAHYSPDAGDFSEKVDGLT
jgi:hypothetical protein